MVRMGEKFPNTIKPHAPPAGPIYEVEARPGVEPG